MASDTATPAETLIIGVNGDSSGNDLIRVESSVTFNWVPDPGSQYSEHRTSIGFNEDGSEYTTDTSTTGLSHAQGHSVLPSRPGGERWSGGEMTT
jgi:hypothetical protein